MYLLTIAPLPRIVYYYIKTAYYVRRTKTLICKRIYIYNILYHSLIVYNIYIYYGVL